MAKRRPRIASKPAFQPDQTALLSSTIRSELGWAGPKPANSAEQAAKKNYAEALSRALAQRFADALRPEFAGILPRSDGSGQESRARTGKGLKKLDVNYSTAELGLGLGLSVKTLNFRDGKSRRYTKNYTRIDNELRAEAADYHERQPYAVMVAVIFLPRDSCSDGGRSPSSFGQAVQIFRSRAGRRNQSDDPTLFERVIIGLYEAAEDNADFGTVEFFDVEVAPPRTGHPRDSFSLGECIALVIRTYDARNKATFVWADGKEEVLAPPPAESPEEGV